MEINPDGDTTFLLTLTLCTLRANSDADRLRCSTASLLLFVAEAEIDGRVWAGNVAAEATLGLVAGTASDDRRDVG